MLIKELCLRLPYSLKVNRPDCGYYDYVSAIDIDAGTLTCQYNGYTDDIEKFIPYLRPMSSMTEDDIKELSKIDEKRFIFSSRHLTYHLDGEIIDYLNRKMFDYHGLIPKGLALEAPKGMYK